MVTATAAGKRGYSQAANQAVKAGIASLGRESAHDTLYAQEVEHLKARGLALWTGGAAVFGPLDLTLIAGMRVALAGTADSGAGELLQVLAGILEPGQGTLTVPPGISRGAALQDVPASSTVTVREYALRALNRLSTLEEQLRRAEQNLDSAAALKRYGELAAEFEAAGGYTAEAELRELLAAFGLGPDRAAETLNSLSGGELRRLELARTLATRPDILLLENPEAGLDPDMRDRLAQRLAAWPGSLVFTSHDRHFIHGIATHVARLQDGRLNLRRGGFPVRRRTRRPGAADGTRSELFSTDGLKVPLHGGGLIRSGYLSVHAGDRIVLLGENGSGKSTLLDFIAADLHSGHGEAGISWADRTSLTYLDQRNSGLAEDLSALGNLALRMSRERARQLLGFVRLPVSLWDEPVAGLSRAGRSRVGLALILADESRLLLLDEPETGLDLAQIELLEDTILQHPGAVILVTHDRQLAENFAGRVWSLSEDGLSDWRGGMEGFRAGRLRREEQLEVPVSLQQQADAQAAAPSVEELEDSLLKLDERLEERTFLSTRQTARLERQRGELTARLMELYDSRYPEPAPRFRVRELGLTVRANLAAGADTLEFEALAGVRPRLQVQAGIAHLSLDVPPDRCLLPRVRLALVNAATRLAFYALDVRVVQHYGPDTGPGLLLEAAGSGWYALARPRFEELEGWQAPAPSGPAGKPLTRRRRRRRPVVTS